MPTTRDLLNRTTASVALSPISVTSNTTRNGTGVDLADKRYVTFIYFGGSITDGTYTFDVDESDDNSTWTNLDSGRLIGTLTVLTAGNAIHQVGAQPTKRYVRINMVSTSTSSGAHAIGAVYVVGDS